MQGWYKVALLSTYCFRVLKSRVRLCQPLPAGPWQCIPEFLVTLPPAISIAELGRRKWFPFCYLQSLPLPLPSLLFEIDPLETTWLVGILGRRSLKALIGPGRLWPPFSLRRSVLGLAW